MNDQKLRFRKHIRLKQFDYNSDGAYFITICTADRKPLISEKYKSIIEEELKGLEKRFQWVSLDYFVSMANHLHFILFLYNCDVGVPRIIQAFKSLTTLKVKKQGYTGKRFWQPNYYEHVIRNEKALNKIRQYVINNPLVEQFDWKEIEK